MIQVNLYHERRYELITTDSLYPLFLTIRPDVIRSFEMFSQIYDDSDAGRNGDREVIFPPSTILPDVTKVLYEEWSGILTQDASVLETRKERRGVKKSDHPFTSRFNHLKAIFSFFSTISLEMSEFHIILIRIPLFPKRSIG